MYLLWVHRSTYLISVRMTYSINSPESKAFLTWLKAEREAAGLSMRDLAERLNKPHSFVQKVESGERRLDVVEYVWYCDALHVPPKRGMDVVIKEQKIQLAAGKKWSD